MVAVTQEGEVVGEAAEGLLEAVAVVEAEEGDIDSKANEIGSLHIIFHRYWCSIK